MTNLMPQLILLAAPLDEETPFDNSVLAVLQNFATNEAQRLILVESAKVARRRWILSGLDRKIIEQFIIFDEQTAENFADLLQKTWQSHGKVFLFSDEGVPCLHDPGKNIVALAHQLNIKVTTVGIHNAFVAALMLSGFSADKFVHHGFPAQKKPERLADLSKFLQTPTVAILMDTAYRLKSTLEELMEIEQNQKLQQKFFLALDLNRPTESYFLGTLKKLQSLLPAEKKDFVLIKDLIKDKLR